MPEATNNTAVAIGQAAGAAIATAAGPTWWERLLYTIFLSFWRAYFDARMAMRQADEEIPNEVANARALRFRDAVRRLRAAQDDPAGPVGPARGG